MATCKSLIPRYFCFFSPHSYGYEAQKEHRPENDQVENPDFTLGHLHSPINIVNKQLRKVNLIIVPKKN